MDLLRLLIALAVGGLVAPATASEEAARVNVPEPMTTPYVVPVANPSTAGWNPTHSTYPATDIFVGGGCGGTVVSPVNGSILEVRRVNSWTASIDNPATRGGRSVAILGDDGVRYYSAHFDTIGPEIVVDAAITAGLPLGTVGRTGRAGACHIHFGISPPCPDKEFSVRRGVVWPYTYLDAWSRGEQLSPAEAVDAWLQANPDGCAAASAHPNAGDS